MKDKSKKSTYSTTFGVDPKSTYSTTFGIDPNNGGLPPQDEVDTTQSLRIQKL